MAPGASIVLIIALAFIAMPILEIAVFVEVGGRIGLGPTVAIVLATALAGAALLRHQGLATLHRARHSLAEGRVPLTEVFDGLCLIVAGALLLTPGFVTDAIGLLLFVPPVRAVLRALVARRLVVAKAQSRTPGGGPVIDGEFFRVEEEETESSRPPPAKVVPPDKS